MGGTSTGVRRQHLSSGLRKIRSSLTQMAMKDVSDLSLGRRIALSSSTNEITRLNTTMPSLRVIADLALGPAQPCFAARTQRSGKRTMAILMEAVQSLSLGRRMLVAKISRWWLREIS
jgi:hypothetical protein